MSTRSRRTRGRPPKTSLSNRVISVRKPKAYGGSEPSSRSSTPVSTTSSTPTTRSSSRISTRSRARVSVTKTIQKVFSVVNQDRESSEEEEGDQNQDAASFTSDIDNELDDLVPVSDDDSFEDSASVYSEASLSTVASVCSTPGKRKFLRPKTPEFIEEDTIPSITLPDSSTDLILSGQSLLRAFGVYEVLRHFRIALRLSPFRFEDFCTALASNEQCCLLAETHMSLMKVLLREEDGNNTMFGPQDTKDSINICMHFLDGMTWPELLRAYLESDQSLEYKMALPALEKADYGSIPIPEKLTILQTLTDLFLSTTSVREELMNEGNIHYDDHCRSCHR